MLQTLLRGVVAPCGIFENKVPQLHIANPAPVGQDIPTDQEIRYKLFHHNQQFAGQDQFRDKIVFTRQHCRRSKRTRSADKQLCPLTPVIKPKYLNYYKLNYINIPLRIESRQTLTLAELSEKSLTSAQYKNHLQ